jgi:hypothetical protein
MTRLRRIHDVSLLLALIILSIGSIVVAAELIINPPNILENVQAFYYYADDTKQKKTFIVGSFQQSEWTVPR